jgi:hypothetical protein
MASSDLDAEDILVGCGPLHNNEGIWEGFFL